MCMPSLLDKKSALDKAYSKKKCNMTGKKHGVYWSEAVEISTNIRSRPHVSGSFGKRIFFYPFWVHVHSETTFSVTENEAFRKHSPE